MNIETISLPLVLKWLQPHEFPHKLGICERVFGKKIALNQVCWVDTAAGIPWKLDLTNPTHRWIVYGYYEGKFFLEWAKKFLNPDAVVVDSGANIGQMIPYLGQSLPRGKILAFEPSQTSGNWIEQCLKVNPNLSVDLLRCGLGNSANTSRLCNPSPDSIHGAQNYISETEGEEIKVVRLADVLKEKKIRTVDLWKLDVEGYEIQALQGAETLLEEKQIKTLYVEMTGENGRDIRNYLGQFGYLCHLFDSQGRLYRPSEFPHHINGLFLPK
jgi:FkbM family methyltransferase